MKWREEMPHSPTPPQVYTYVTDIVIAINPYKYYAHLCTLPDRPFRYGEEGVKCAPHVWSIGHTSFHGLVGTHI